MKRESRNLRLTDEELSLIQALYGLGRKEVSMEEMVARRPEVRLEQLLDIESRALRKLRFLDARVLKDLKLAG